MAKKRKAGTISGLKADGTPNAYWRRFKERLDSYQDIPLDKWEAEQVLGHVLNRYKTHAKIEYGLSYSGAPTKCKEIYCIKRMIYSLGTEDPTIIKKYIDWTFDNIIIDKNMDVSSMAFFFTANIIQKFKVEHRKDSKLTRATQLPSQFEAIAKDLDIFTYGDLAFAKMAIESDPEDNESYVNLFVKLKDNGFDDTILERLEAS